jgi:polyisoprenoid-binding protein YceI
MLKRPFFALAALIIFVSPALAQTWKIDKAHSSVSFTVQHLVISKVTGYFRDYDAAIDFDGKNLDKGSVNATVQMTSVDTDNDRRDTHLRSADFFDVEKYPTMTFVSKKIVPGDGKNFTMIGDLTIRDKTREVTFAGELNGIITDPRGNSRAGLSATTTINRQDFGVAWANKLQDGSLVVSNDVDIQLEIEMVEEK